MIIVDNETTSEALSTIAWLMACFEMKVTYLVWCRDNLCSMICLISLSINSHFTIWKTLTLSRREKKYKQRFVAWTKQKTLRRRRCESDRRPAKADYEFCEWKSLWITRVYAVAGFFDWNYYADCGAGCWASRAPKIMFVWTVKVYFRAGEESSGRNRE